MNRNNFLSGLLRTTLAAGALAVSAAPVFADDDKNLKKEEGEKKEKKEISSNAANAAQVCGAASRSHRAVKVKSPTVICSVSRFALLCG